MKKVLELKKVSKIYSETKNITNFLSKSEDKFVAVDNVSFSLQSWCTGRHEHSQMISVLIENTAGDENGTPDKPAS